MSRSDCSAGPPHSPDNPPKPHPSSPAQSADPRAPPPQPPPPQPAPHTAPPAASPPHSNPLTPAPSAASHMSRADETPSRHRTSTASAESPDSGSPPSSARFRYPDSPRSRT